MQKALLIIILAKLKNISKDCFFYVELHVQGCSAEGEKVRALLVGEGQGGELLTLLEEAITRGDHRYREESSSPSWRKPSPGVTIGKGRQASHPFGGSHHQG